MRKLSNNVSISNFRYTLNKGLLKNIAENLSDELVDIVKNQHLNSLNLAGKPLPDYTEGYINYKASVLGVSTGSIKPNLDLTGELHDNAKAGIKLTQDGFDSVYSISSLGDDHLSEANRKSKTWEDFSLIGKKIWKESIIPVIDRSIIEFGNKFGVLESVTPQ